MDLLAARFLFIRTMLVTELLVLFANRIAQYHAVRLHRAGDGLASCFDGLCLVVHLAACIHVLHEVADDPLALYSAVNAERIFNFARQAAQSGVSRFVYLSSVKVNGEVGQFSEESPLSPHERFAMSKWEAGQDLLKISADTDMEVMILHCPWCIDQGSVEISFG